jgi:hypothetical protein
MLLGVVLPALECTEKRGEDGSEEWAVNASDAADM